MATRSPSVALADIIDVNARIRTEVLGTAHEEFERDWRKRWIVERGVEIISEASRRLPDDLKTRHPEIPWAKVAGIGNVLRHEYERIAPAILWNVIAHDLAPLEAVCIEERRRLGLDLSST